MAPKPVKKTILKKPAGFRKEDLEQHDKEEPPLTFKQKVAMLDDKLQAVKDGDIVNFDHSEMKRLWGRLQTGLQGNEKALSLYKNVQQLPVGQQKKHKQQHILWAWWWP